MVASLELQRGAVEDLVRDGAPPLPTPFVITDKFSFVLVEPDGTEKPLHILGISGSDSSQNGKKVMLLGFTSNEQSSRDWRVNDIRSCFGIALLRDSEPEKANEKPIPGTANLCVELLKIVNHFSNRYTREGITIIKVVRIGRVVPYTRTICG